MKSLSFFLFLPVLSLMTCLFMCSPKVKDEDRRNYIEEGHDKFFGKSVSERDADFIANAVAANYDEIKFARLALSKSSNPQVKHIATLLERDHSKVLAGLICFAHKRGIVIPAEESHDAKIKISSLKDRHHTEFDRRWCLELLDKHEMTVKQFEYMWEKTEDIELRAWIRKSLPELMTHLEHLMEYQDNSSPSPNLRMTASQGRTVSNESIVE